MLSKLVALSSVSMALAATGSRTALCTALLDNTGCGNATATQFPDPQTTVAECEQLFATAVTEDGDDTNTTGNTIGCRQYWAAQAKATNALWKCKFAGFTGGGVCQDAAPGGVVKAACNVIDAACTGNPYYPYANSSDCAGVLNPMAAVWGSNQGNRAAAENSLECRVYHALVGWNRATTGQEIHCGHVTLPSNATFCGGGVTTHPEHYCTTVMSSTCGSPATQYGSMDICLNSFKTFPDANATSTETGNNRGCRQYHAQAAVSLQDASHCYHGGPSGGGVCGGAAGGRVAWQILTNNSNCQGNNSWVAMSVGLAFAAWAPADLLAVVPGGDPTVYNTTVYSSTNNDLCRLYHLTVATTAVDHCSHGSISGAGQCGNVTTITCALINQGCPSNYANAEACAADIMPLFAKPGDPSQMMMAPTDDSLQCRVYYAGLALVGKAMSNTTTTAAACASAKNNGSMACVGAAPTDAAAPSTSGVAPVAASLMVLIPALLL